GGRCGAPGPGSRPGREAGPSARASAGGTGSARRAVRAQGVSGGTGAACARGCSAPRFSCGLGGQPESTSTGARATCALARPVIALVTPGPAVTSATPSEPESSACACRSEEHTSELQSRENLVCRLLLEKKKNTVTRQARH